MDEKWITVPAQVGEVRVRMVKPVGATGALVREPAVGAKAALVVAGDSAGGTVTAVLTHLAKRRGNVTFLHQSLYCPVTDAAERAQITASPLRATRAKRTRASCYRPACRPRVFATTPPCTTS